METFEPKQISEGESPERTVIERAETLGYVAGNRRCEDRTGNPSNTDLRGHRHRRVCRDGRLNLGSPLYAPRKEY